MKKALIWFGLLATSVALIVFIFGENSFLPLSLLFMIGIHELGHLGAARYLGYETGGFYFIPGLGGVALLKELPRKRWHGFLIWYAGPMVGFLETLILFLVNFLWLEIPILYMASFLWAIVNLFNLLPVLPLDGGKMVWSVASDKNEKYLSSLLYFFLTGLSLLFIFRLTGIVWPLLLLWFGSTERKIFINICEKEGPRIPMTTRQRICAAFLSLALQVALMLLVYASLMVIPQF